MEGEFVYNNNNQESVVNGTYRCDKENNRVPDDRNMVMPPHPTDQKETLSSNAVEMQKIRAEERWNSIKSIQQYCKKNRVLCGKFESNWQGHFAEYSEISNQLDIHNQDNFTFFHPSLADDSDARQYYDALVTNARDSGVVLRWKSLDDSFATSFVSLTKKRRSRIDWTPYV